MMLPHWAILAATKISTSETGSDTEVRISGEAKNINSFANILNTVYFWAGVVAVIVIIVAGFELTRTISYPSDLRALQAWVPE